MTSPDEQAVERARTARVIVASNRAAAGIYVDETGPPIVAALRAWGFDTPDADVVPDGDPVGVALWGAVSEQVDVVLTTGGTGISPTDRTPEATERLIDRRIPGIAEAIRAHGIAKGVATAALSRGVAGVSGRTLVINLPGSRGGVADALEVLGEIVPHAVSQLGGADH